MHVDVISFLWSCINQQVDAHRECVINTGQKHSNQDKKNTETESAYKSHSLSWLYDVFVI